MGDVPTFLPDVNKLPYPFAGSIAVNKNDAIMQDSAGTFTTAYDVVPAASVLFASCSPATKAGAQALFAAHFAGMAADQRSTSQTRADPILVDGDWIGPVTVTSSTYHIGTLLTPKQNGGGTALQSAAFEATTDSALAVGMVVRESGASATTVLARFKSRVCPTDFQSGITTILNASVTDGDNISLGVTTGSQIGTASNQKLAFLGATPIIQETAAISLETVLSDFGLRASGTAAPLAVGNTTISDAHNVILGSSTGNKIGTATTQKLGFWNVTPVVQPSGSTLSPATMGIGANTAMTALNSAVAAMGTNGYWGFNTQAAFNSFITEIQALVVDTGALNTQLNLARTDILALNTELQAIQMSLVNTGIIKNGA